MRHTIYLTTRTDYKTLDSAPVAMAMIQIHRGQGKDAPCQWSGAGIPRISLTPDLKHWIRRWWE